MDNSPRSVPIVRSQRWRAFVLAVTLAAGTLSAQAVSAAPAKPTASPPKPTYLIYTTGHGLWSARVNGGPPRLIAQGLDRPVARVSADGRYVLFAFPGSLTVAGVPAATGWRQLFISRVDGSDTRVVATLPASSYGALFTWSNDDSHFLYVRVRVTGPPPKKSGIPTWPWEMRAVDSSAGTATTVWSGQLNRFSPVPLAWRRDLGIVYTLNSVAGGFSTRYAQVDVATRSATEITLHDIVTAQVVPSPRQYYDGIASRTNGHLASIGIYAIGAIQSGVTSVTLAHQNVIGPLCWSLTGGNLAYTTIDTSARVAATARTHFHIFSLVLGRDRVVGAAGLNADVLAWSPDGTQLLIRYQTNGKRSLYLLAAKGAATRQRLVVDTPLTTVAEGFVGWGTGS